MGTFVFFVAFVSLVAFVVKSILRSPADDCDGCPDECRGGCVAEGERAERESKRNYQV